MKRWTLASMALLLGLSLLLVDSTPLQAKSHWNKRGWLGVEVQSVDRELADAFKLKSEYGVVINDVDADSPAEEAGLEESDVIIKVNDQRIVDADDLSETIGDLNPGEKASITYIRDGKENHVDVTLARQPKSSRYYYGNANPRAYSYSIPPMPDMPPMPPAPPAPAAPRWNRGLNVFNVGDDANASGLHVIELTKGLQEFLGTTSHGAFVTDVERHSEAADAGIKAGDVIIKADNEKVFDPDDLFETLSDIDEGDTVAFTIIRDKKEITVKMEVEENDDNIYYHSGSGWGARVAPRMKGLSFGNANGFGYSFDMQDLNEEIAKLNEEIAVQAGRAASDKVQQRLDELRKRLETLEEKLK